MLGLSLVLIILFYIGFAIAAVLVALIAASAGAVAGAGGAAAVGIVGILLVVGAFVWLEVRLSLAFPLTLLRRKIIIGESWRLSRGRFWTLFGAYLAIFVIIVVISIVGGLVTSGSYVFDMIRNAGNSAGMQQVMQAQMARQFGSITAITVIGWIVNAVLGAVVIALSGGAVATAVRELITDEDSIAETFA
jgi:hypothetical protein